MSADARTEHSELLENIQPLGDSSRLDEFPKQKFIDPLSSVPAILAGGAAIMAIAGIVFLREAPSWQRIVGVAFAIIGLSLLRK